MIDMTFKRYWQLLTPSRHSTHAGKPPTKDERYQLRDWLTAKVAAEDIRIIQKAADQTEERLANDARAAHTSHWYR